jgi:hypothetical protein
MIGVTIGPGATVLTRMPRPASSAVREFGHVPLHRHDAVADGFDRFVQGFSASAQDGYPRAFFLQALGRG